MHDTLSPAFSGNSRGITIRLGSPKIQPVTRSSLITTGEKLALERYLCRCFGRWWRSATGGGGGGEGCDRLHYHKLNTALSALRQRYPEQGGGGDLSVGSDVHRVSGLDTHREADLTAHHGFTAARIQEGAPPPPFLPHSLLLLFLLHPSMITSLSTKHLDAGSVEIHSGSFTIQHAFSSLVQA